MCYNVYTKIVGAFDCAPLIVPAHDMVLNLQSRRENFTRYQILRAVKSAGRNGESTESPLGCCSLATKHGADCDSLTTHRPPPNLLGLKD